MPTKPTRRKRKPRIDLSGSEWKWGWESELEIGHRLLNHCGRGGDTELLREAWQIVRDEMLPKWTEEKPLSRPFAWWRFEAPGERRLTRLCEQRKLEYPEVYDPKHRTNTGTYIKHNLLFTHTMPPLQESEVEFLHRHELLTAFENGCLEDETRAILKKYEAGEFDPEERFNRADNLFFYKLIS